MNTRKSQTKKILDHMSKGRKITNLYAISMWQITSFHRRLSDIKKQGITIDSRWCNGETKFKEYWLPKVTAR